MRTIKTLGTVSLATAAFCALLVGACGGDSTTSTGGTGGSTAGTGGGTDNTGGTGGDLFGSGGSGLDTGTGGDTSGSTGGSGGTRDGGPLTDAQAGGGGVGGDAAIVDGSTTDGQAGGGADAGHHHDAGKPCGNGVVDPGEDCDPGAGNTAACTPLCKWLCSPGAAGDTFCDDHLLCDGTEKCSTDHICVPGTKATDGTSCGGGNVCKGGLCASSSCGDGVRVDPEECDDGNKVNGDGCNTDCTFSCLSSDSARNCSAQQTACVSTITCNDGTHTCSTPTSKPDNTTCGTHAYCKTGACIPSVCGNGKVEPTEICDDGNKVDGDGCNSDCTFSCVTPNSDCAAAPSCEKQTCTAAHACKPVADTSKDDTSCGTNKVCSNGTCVAACGNSIVDSGEQCDDGNNVNGDGCDSCKFSCSNPATDCTTTAPACDKWTCNGNSHICEAVADSTKNDTACGSGLVCNNSGSCVNSCGNSVVDAGEQCDDGNNVNGDGCQTTCKFTCSNPATDCAGNAGACEKWSCGSTTHVCAAVADTSQNGQSCGSGQVCAAGACGNSCGNSVVDAGEQCDDGNKVSGDGCENNCKFSCSNPATDCTPTPCQTTTCSGAHICQTAADGSQNDHACGSGLVCSAGSCIAACGNSIVDGADGEQCDDGNKVNGDGCNNNCTFSCSNPVNDCAAPAVCQIASCSGAHTCQTGPDASQNDQACAAGKVCSAGSCITACGNNLVDAGEQCDDGNQTNGDGCDNDCTFSCVTPATDCAAPPACQKETCTAGHVCQASADATKDDQTCGTNQVCANGSCVASCGNGIVDPGEQCDPPNTATCDANCQNQCAVDGSWASLLKVNVTWPATSVVQKGTGVIQVASLITSSNNGATNTVLPCGIVVPNFKSILGTSYFITFPASLFENTFLNPGASMTASYSNLKAGATYATTAAFTSLIGISAPVTGTWPAIAGITTTDPEGDGHPGITASTDAPTTGNPFGPDPADFLYLGLRQTTALSGTLTDCTHLTGTANVSHQDSHVVGCHKKTAGTCDSGFLDTNRPVYAPVAGGATFTAVKMGNAPTCANVRATVGAATFP